MRGSTLGACPARGQLGRCALSERGYEALLWADRLIHLGLMFIVAGQRCVDVRQVATVLSGYLIGAAPQPPVPDDDILPVVRWPVMPGVASVR